MTNVMDLTEHKEEKKVASHKKKIAKKEVAVTNDELPKEEVSKEELKITPVVEESKTNVLQDYADIFTEAHSQMKSFTEIHKYTEMVASQVNNLAKATIGRGLQKEDINKISEKIASYGKKFDELTDAEIEEILNSYIDIDFSKTTAKTETEKKLFRKEFLSLIYSTEEAYNIFDKAQIEIQEAEKDFTAEVEDILSSVSLIERLNEIQEKIAQTDKEEEKKRLQDIYSGMYASIHLETITTKLITKGLKTIQKEVKKDFEKAQKKCYQIMKNDRQNLCMSPQNLDTALYKLFPDDKEAINILLYLIYKKVNKRNTLDMVTATFMNYFILNIVKLMKTDISVDESEVYLSVKKFVSDYKSGKWA